MPTDSQMADIDAQSGDYPQPFLPPMGDIEIQMYHCDDEFGFSHPAPMLPDDELDNETFDSPCGACQGMKPLPQSEGGGGLRGTTRRPNAAAGGKGANLQPESAWQHPPKLAKAQKKTKRKAACEVEKLTRIDAQRIRKWKLRTIAVALGLGLIASLSLYFVVDSQGDEASNEITVLVADNRDEKVTALTRQLEVMGEEMALLVAATALTTNASLPNATVDLWDSQATHHRDEFPSVVWIGWTAMEQEVGDGSLSWQESPPALQGANVSSILTPIVVDRLYEAAVRSQGALTGVNNRGAYCWIRSLTYSASCERLLFNYRPLLDQNYPQPQPGRSQRS
jgi:hypothetical protein